MRQVAAAFGAELALQTTKQDDHPQDQAHDEQNLPQTTQIKIFPTLCAEEGPRGALQPALIAGGFSREAANDDHYQRGEQGNRKWALATGLAAGDQRSQKNAGSKVRRHDKEQSQLQMPCAREVIREPLRKINSEEATCLRVVVGRCAAEQRLQQKQSADNEKVPARDLLRRG